jgi:hypothetical protein
MITKLTIAVNDEERDFFESHIELSPTRLMRMAVRDYKKRLGEPLGEEEKA